MMINNSDDHPSGSRCSGMPTHISLRSGTDRNGRPCFLLSDGAQGDWEFTVIVNSLKKVTRDILGFFGATPEEKEAVMAVVFPGTFRGRTWIPSPAGATGHDSDSGMEVVANLLMRLRGANSQRDGTAQKSPRGSF